VRWLVDECVDAGLVSHLRDAGHDVVYVAEIAPAANDTEVMTRARTERRVLLTEDKDFGDLVFRGRASIPGVVLLRIDPALHELKRARLDAALSRFGENLLGRYTIVEPTRFRTRSMLK